MQFPRSHPVFDDHFPGRPVVPGVLLLEAAAGQIESGHGPVVRIDRAKFPVLLLPERDFTIELSRTGDGSIRVSAASGAGVHLDAVFTSAPSSESRQVGSPMASRGAASEAFAAPAPANPGPDRVDDLLPHGPCLRLIDEIVSWDDRRLVARTRRHRAPEISLRQGGRLSAVCAIEMAAQAAAIHGALSGDGVPRPGVLASVRDATLPTRPLDDLGEELEVEIRMTRAMAEGRVYDTRVLDVSPATGRSDGVPSGAFSGRVTVFVDSAFRPMPG